MENHSYLTDQLITYLGNKRSLLSFLEVGLIKAKGRLAKEKLSFLDAFTGSGVVARFLRKDASTIYTCDLEPYCEILSSCYMRNKNLEEENFLQEKIQTLNSISIFQEGFIAELYSPKDDSSIQEGDRVFYTRRNALFLDTVRKELENIEEPYRTRILAPLIVQASIHTNTSGVFKGFHKNPKTGLGQFGGGGSDALSRIKKDIQIPMPVISNFQVSHKHFQGRLEETSSQIPSVDIAYLDPPYNQHPYGSNYFMLNLIASYEKPNNVSQVSGIPTDWNRSDFNKKNKIQEALTTVCENIQAKILLISFNNEGFLTEDEMEKTLSTIGEVEVYRKPYSAYKGSRNLNSRNLKVEELLFYVEKV